MIKYVLAFVLFMMAGSTQATDINYHPYYGYGWVHKYKTNPSYYPPQTRLYQPVRRFPVKRIDLRPQYYYFK